MLQITNINSVILKKAEQILEDKEIERLKQKALNEYIDTCIKAEICPKCGEQSLEVEKWTYNKEYNESSIDTYCKLDHSHFYIRKIHHDDYDD